MRKRRNKPNLPPTPEPASEVEALESEQPVEPEPEPVADSEVDTVLAEAAKVEHVLVSQPPSIYMLWCPECNRVGPHLVVHTPECNSDPVVVKYKPEED